MEFFLPKTIEATHFQLELEDGRKVGEKTEVKKRLEHMPILFTDSSVLRVKLYKDKSLIYEALLDGTDYSGTLELKPVDQTGKINALKGQSFGAYKLIENDKTGMTSLFISPGDAFGADAYKMLSISEFENRDSKSDTGVLTKIDKEIIGLTFVMKDLKGYVLQFYQGDKPVFIGSLEAGETSSEGKLIVGEANSGGD